MLRTHLNLFALAALLTAGCQTNAPVGTPAYLADTSREALFILPGQVAQALGVANVDLGPLAEREPGAITVLPRPGGPFEGNNPDVPVTFPLVIRGGECFLKDPASTNIYRLVDVACIPLSR